MAKCNICGGISGDWCDVGKEGYCTCSWDECGCGCVINYDDPNSRHYCEDSWEGGDEE